MHDGHLLCFIKSKIYYCHVKSILSPVFHVKQLVHTINYIILLSYKFTLQ